ncbi:MAG: sulfatase-like hydrolase/transferase, partial [Planctomycetaceae bacterium]
MRRAGCLATVVGVFVAVSAVGSDAAPPRPNVVVILADDLGFSDLGCYGGEIETPNLDRLAARGLRFTQGYNTARCWPSRGALLTGYYPQAIRRDALPAAQGGSQGVRPSWARLLPQLLEPAGYVSYHSGKWHVDGDPRRQGFTHSLQIEGGQNDFFDPEGVTVDGKPIAAGQDFYVTTAVGEHAVDCLESHAITHSGKPFFSYVAFTSPHFPLQAPQDLVAKYRDRYATGWGKIQEARFRRLKEIGIVSSDLATMERDVGPPYPPKPEVLARLGDGELDRPLPWTDLTPSQHVFQSTKMAIHAAMVEVMDRAIGRIIGQLESMNVLDDTFILFASDNGASAEIMIRGKGHDPVRPAGSSGTFLCLGPGWSSCANTPFRRHTTWVHEGGIASPWIVHWPNGIDSSAPLRTQPVHLVDVAPTLLELAGLTPVREHEGRPVPPMQGQSFVRALTDPAAEPAHETLWWCHEGHRAVREGNWKLVAARSTPWELYDLSKDRSETRNLATDETARVERLSAAWQRIADECRALAASETGDPDDKGRGAKRRETPRESRKTVRTVDPRPDPPNIVVIFADDMGYGDPGCYGGTVAATPAIDRLAREGVRFTDFHVAQAVCSASRAALLTGCYPNRIGISGALGPNAQHGIAAAETTLAELLRSRGYRTAAVGKWHLGHHPSFLPTRHGFDEYFGLAYSNDMWPLHPEAKPGTYPPLPLFEQERIVDEEVTPEDQATLTARYTTKAVSFIERAGRADDGRPFFLYLAHSMPHVPLFAGESFRGTSPGGLYGDVISEVDASVAAVLEALERTGHDDDTLVIVTSDNGPWLLYGEHAGSAGPLREGKATAFEGGVRVPCVARLPGMIPAGRVCETPLMTIDLLPTLATVSGSPLSTDASGRLAVSGRTIDGHDRLSLFTGVQPAAKVEEPVYCFWYAANELQAVRQGPWKLFFPHVTVSMEGQQSGRGGFPGRYKKLEVGKWLFNLDDDPGERTDLAASHPDIVSRLESIADAAREELGDRLTGKTGSGVRPAGNLPPSSPTGRRPNIIYVITDDQGYGDIAAHGNPFVKTPVLDRLRRESVRLSEFHASPTCSPTRAAFLTGRHEFRSGVTHTILERERLALSATTLPELLGPAGYTSGIFGKWHLGDEDAYQPDRRGFDRVFIHGAGGIGQTYPGSCGDVPGNRYYDPVIRSDGAFVKTKGYCTDVFFDAALEWIDDCRKGDQPFFCYIATNAPHAPSDCPFRSDAAYRKALDDAELPEAGRPARNEVARFYGMIENIDSNIGKLLARLDAWGLADDTLLVFTTDNGSAAGHQVFNAGMRGAKGTPYRGGTRVPSFWRWPGTLPQNVDVPAVTAHIDVLPTICELAGAAIPESLSSAIEGRSLLPLLVDAAAPWPDRPLFPHLGRWERGRAAESGLRNCRVREGHWSLVNTHNDPAAWELYDLLSDPGETTTLSAAYPRKTASMSDTYGRWWSGVQESLVNEDLDGPDENPFKAAYWTQFGPRPTLVDVPYGGHPKQRIHFWKTPLASDEKPAPLLYYVHGGGWQAGDRLAGLTPMLPKLLQAGISVASVEYRFINEAIDEGIEPPVRAPLHDAARGLQTVRAHAE